MALESISANLDPLLWARKPRSQTALDFVRRGASGNNELSAILQQHIADGVCTDSVDLLLRWEGCQWVSVPTT